MFYYFLMKTKIHHKELRILGTKEWLNDEIINAYFSLLQAANPTDIRVVDSLFFSQLLSYPGPVSPCKLLYAF